MRKHDEAWALSVASGALGVIAALTLAAPTAQADPEVLVPPPPPPALLVPAEESISTQAAAGDPATQAAVGDPAPPAEIPHLFSPENLPPGTTNIPLDPQQGRTTSYLRDLWHAVQTQEISGRDMVLLLAQRPLNPNAVPTNGLAAGPQAPLSPEAAPPGPLPPEAAPPGPLPPEAAPPGPLPPEAAPPAPAPPELVPPPAPPIP